MIFIRLLILACYQDLFVDFGFLEVRLFELDVFQEEQIEYIIKTLDLLNFESTLLRKKYFF